MHMKNLSFKFIDDIWLALLALESHDFVLFWWREHRDGKKLNDFPGFIFLGHN